MLPYAFLAAVAAEPCPSHLAALTSIADFGVTYCFELKSTPASCDGAYFTRADGSSNTISSCRWKKCTGCSACG